MAFTPEFIEPVKLQKGKDGDDIALVAPDAVKDWEAKGYKAVKAEAPKAEGA